MAARQGSSAKERGHSSKPPARRSRETAVGCEESGALKDVSESMSGLYNGPGTLPSGEKGRVIAVRAHGPRGGSSAGNDARDLGDAGGRVPG